MWMSLQQQQGTDFSRKEGPRPVGGILLSVDKETSNECVSAPSEVRKGGHGVPDPVFGARGTRAHLGVKVPCGG